MRKLNLKTSSYQYLETAFNEWLKVLGYSKGSVNSMTAIGREFLYYLEREEAYHIQALKQKHFKGYKSYISERQNEKRAGLLSNNYINKHIQGVEKFMEFLHHKGVQNLPSISLRQNKLFRPEITTLTTKEVEMLYSATKDIVEHTEKRNTTLKTQAIAARDRAMLTVMYGCGLRRNETVHVDLSDINLDTRVLHVKKGKNYKQRFVPISKRGSKYLQDYIYDHRPVLAKTKRQGRLFLSVSGKPMLGGAMYVRLQLLKMATGDITLQQKNVTPHILRHSIATHLLEAGMSLENISRFLGHASLESTQIYTHLINKREEENRIKE